MMNLNDLVPPLELCKLIPEGEFEDSALCWVDKGYACVLPDGVIPPERHPFVELRRYTIQGDEIPAPTLQEIMAKIPFAQVSIFANKSFVIHPRFGKERHMRYHDNNAATAALKLWLKMKGIDNE